MGLKSGEKEGTAICKEKAFAFHVFLEFLDLGASVVRSSPWFFRDAWG
jgi:hypothetical protein